jgi:fused signal recognition particle receptor
MSGAIDDLLDSFDTLSEDLYTELEEILVMGDVGVTTAVEITQNLRERAKKKRLDNPQQIKDEIKSIVAEMLEGGEDMGLVTVPSIILVIGVNGVGKTTTIGKMAAMYKAQGKKVILAAADTFRAAAIDQLQVWADRAGVDIVKHKEGADPAAVIFDTISAAKARESDIIICDTAGRLHNKKNLMDELAKIYRVIDRELPYSDREVLLVLDATTGQNAVNQAREFMSVAELTGIILTKLDGTARGGVVLSIKNELKIPVKFVGVGEKIDDLQPFDPKAFAEGLFESVTESEFPEDYALAEAENYEDSAIYTAEAEEIPEEAGADDKDIPEDEPAAAVEEEPADIDTADSEGNDEYTQSEESVVEEEEVKEDKKRRKGLFGIFSKK